MSERPNYYLPSVSAYDAITAAVKSGAAITLTLEQAGEVYRDMREIREARQRPPGAPSHPLWTQGHSQDTSEA